MGLFSFWVSSRNARLVAELAAEAAVHSHESVWAGVRFRASKLSPAEARGYVRARARASVELQTERVLAARPEGAASLAPQVLERAIEQVVTMVLRELNSLSGRNVAQRRAA